MGLIDRLLAWVRSDPVQVSVGLDPGVASPGATVEATVTVTPRGGDRRVEAVGLTVDRYDPDAEEAATVVDRQIAGEFTLGRGEERTVTAAFELPPDLRPASEESALVVATVETPEGGVSEMAPLHFEE